MKKFTIFISAGEVSGDVHASYLSREILKLNPDIKLIGLGSNEMKSANVEIIYDMSLYSAVGIVENISFLPEIFKTYKIAKNFIAKNKIDLAILVDWQGFNLRLINLLKKENIPIVYYIGPQEWIWGFSKNIKKILDKVDILFAIFKKEYETYKPISNNVKYLGNPLLDILKISDKLEIKKSLGLEKDSIVLGIMPGSRKHEIKRLLPIFLETSKELQKVKENLKTILIIPALWENFLKNNFDLSGIKLLTNNSSYYMQACDLLLVASGTVTLEASILGIPTIANYKVSKLTYIIARMLMKIEYITLPNIISNKKIISEFLQEDVNSQNLKNECLKLLDNEEIRNKMLKDFEIVREELKPYGAIEKIARIIVKMLYKLNI